MKDFPVDDDLVALIWQRAAPKPFENLSFSEALRRVLSVPELKGSLDGKKAPTPLAEEMLAELESMSDEQLEALQTKVKEKRAKRASSPKRGSWVSNIPELRAIPGLRTWKDICNHLGIETDGDSARRRLKNWVKSNRASWPDVPDVGPAAQQQTRETP